MQSYYNFIYTSCSNNLFLPDSDAKPQIKLSSANSPHLTYQVVNAKQQCFNATITLPIPAGSKTQIYPDQLWQKLQCESLQPNFRTTV